MIDPEDTVTYALALATDIPEGAVATTAAGSAAAATEAIKAEVRTLVVTGPDIQGLLTAVSADMQIVPTMEIDCDEMAEELMTALGRLSTVSGAIEAERTERKRPLLETGRWLDAGYSPAKASVDNIIAGGKAKLSAWSRAKAEAARKKAEAEAAERQRKAAEAAQAEADALAAARAAAATASAARDAGSEQVADAMETQAMVQVDQARANAAAAAQAVYTAPVKLTGGGGVKGASETWKASCTSKADLIAHIGKLITAGDLSLVDLLDVSEKNLNAMAKLQKANLKLPGVAPYPESRVAVRKQAVAA